MSFFKTNERIIDTDMLSGMVHVKQNISIYQLFWLISLGELEIY